MDILKKFQYFMGVSGAFRLFQISSLCLAVLAVFIMGLRTVGLQQRHSNFDHPLLGNSFLVIEPWFSGKNDQLSKQVRPLALENVGGKNLQRLFLVDCDYVNSQWVVSQLGISLKLFLRENSNKKFILNVLSIQPGVLPLLVGVLRDSLALKRVAIQSPVALVNRELRKKAPQLIFVAHPKDWAKLSLLSALFLESLGTTSSDIYIVDFGREAYFKKEIKELQRRKKRIVLRTQLNRLKSVNYHYDGVSLEALHK